MSRIGKKPITVPDGVEVSVEGREITVRGPKGTLHRELRPEIGMEVRGGEIAVSVKKKTKRSAALWGLYRTLVANMVEGVSMGFLKKLEVRGIGYKANVENGVLVLVVGYSHPVRIDPPQGITFDAQKNIITVSGHDKELVGETAATIRRVRKPEPYKGKGIRYQGEVVRKKAGKKAASGS